MLPVVNVSTYRFVELDDLPDLRQRLELDATARGLRGTILLAPEGLNLAMAGEPEAMADFLCQLQDDPRFAGLDIKESRSARMPFKRLRVRIKREIIRLDQPQLRPHAGRAASVTPETLERWLDQGHDDAGRPVLMLDTRNAFEVDEGGFEHAVDWRLDRFGAFPSALEQHRAALDGHTVVSYCTGGIRCEKAALLMRDAGLEHVLQLEGGILRYLEYTQAKHWRGRCVVFDDRASLDPQLREPADASATGD